MGGVISGAGTATLTLAGSGTVVLTASNTYTGTPRSIPASCNWATALRTARSAATSSTTPLVFANATAQSYAGAITGNGGVTLDGPGGLTLSGANGYTGGTTIDGAACVGQRQCLGHRRPGLGRRLLGPGRLLDDRRQPVSHRRHTHRQRADVDHQRPQPISAESGTIGVNLAGNVALDKTSDGTLLLSGSNSYLGGTSISAGVVQLGNDAALPSSGCLTINAGTLDLAGHHATVAALAGSGQVSNSTGSAAITIDDNAATPATVNATLADGTGTTGLVKSGSGRLVLANAANTYSGGTTVSSGVLQLGSAAALGSTLGGLTLDAGTLDLAGKSPTVGALRPCGGHRHQQLAAPPRLRPGRATPRRTSAASSWMASGGWP